MKIKNINLKAKVQVVVVVILKMERFPKMVSLRAMRLKQILVIILGSSTAQGSVGSFNDRKLTRGVNCCDAWLPKGC